MYEKTLIINKKNLSGIKNKNKWKNLKMSRKI
jgi:hypothetical protein